MSTHKMSTNNYIGWIVKAIIIALLTQASISQGADRLFSWPLIEDVKQPQSNASLKSYEMRKGQVAIAQDFLPSLAGIVDHKTGMVPSKGDIVSIGLFADVTYEVIIDSINHNADGTIVISGKLNDHKIGTVVITIGPDRFIMTVQDMNRSWLYRVTGDSRIGSGTVTEMDMKKLPPMIR